MAQPDRIDGVHEEKCRSRRDRRKTHEQRSLPERFARMFWQRQAQTDADRRKKYDARVERAFGRPKYRDDPWNGCSANEARQRRVLTQKVCCRHRDQHVAPKKAHGAFRRVGCRPNEQRIGQVEKCHDQRRRTDPMHAQHAIQRSVQECRAREQRCGLEPKKRVYCRANRQSRRNENVQEAVLRRRVPKQPPAFAQRPDGAGEVIPMKRIDRRKYRVRAQSEKSKQEIWNECRVPFESLGARHAPPVCACDDGNSRAKNARDGKCRAEGPLLEHPHRCEPIRQGH